MKRFKPIFGMPVYFGNVFKQLKSSTVTISFSNSSIYSDEDIDITVSIPSDATGYVECIIGREYYSKQLISTAGSDAVFIVSGLSIGIKNVIVNYLGNNEYRSCNNTDSFEVIGTPSAVISFTTDNSEYDLGDIITTLATVTNDGDIPLTNVVVSSAVLNHTWNVGTLNPGSSYIVNTHNTHTVTEADILDGELNYDLSVSSTELDDPIEDYYGYTIASPNPNLTISFTPDNTEYVSGETIDAGVLLSNTGNVSVTNISISSDKTSDNWSLQYLNPGDTYDFTASYIVQEEDLFDGAVIIDITAGGVAGSQNVSVSNTYTYSVESANPELQIEFGEDSTEYPVDSTIYPSVTITNTGNITLSNISIGADGYVYDNELAPGSYTNPDITLSHTVTGTDISNDGVYIEITATCEDAVGNTYEFSEGYTYSVLQRYTITINYYVDGSFDRTASTTYDAGAQYSISIPAKQGYTAEDVNGNTMDRITGVITENLTYNVYYVKDMYTLTIRYVYRDTNTMAAPTYTGEYAYGATYNVASPSIEGYTTSRPSVSGTMGASNVGPIIVYYSSTGGSGGIIDIDTPV